MNSEFPSDPNKNDNTDDELFPDLDPERAEQILNEAGKAVSGEDLGADPREDAALREERKRLQTIADQLNPSKPTED